MTISISWEEYFMELAKLTAKRSKDPNTQVGACIINNENKVVGLGYNGFVNIPDNDNIFPWSKKPSDKFEDTKYAYVVHAEANAILNAISGTKDCTLYVTLYPCHECVKLIIQSGIKKIIYLDYKADEASKRMLKAANIEVIHYYDINDSRRLNYNGNANRD